MPKKGGDHHINLDERKIDFLLDGVEGKNIKKTAGRKPSRSKKSESGKKTLELNQLLQINPLSQLIPQKSQPLEKAALRLKLSLREASL